MFRNFSIFALFSSLLFLNLAEAMEGQEAERKTIPIKISDTGYFRDVPDDFIINVGSSLFGKNFLNFALTSSRFKDLLMNYKAFFMPNENEVIKVIACTSIKNVSDLTREWRNTKNARHTLLKVLPHFEEYPSEPNDDLKAARKNFKNYVMTLNTLYGLGDKSMEEKYISIYRQIQSLLCDERAQDDSKTYVFHLKNFSYINPETRQAIAEMYQQGISPFEKNVKKSAKYSKPLMLPLSPDKLF